MNALLKGSKNTNNRDDNECMYLKTVIKQSKFQKTSINSDISKTF